MGKHCCQNVFLCFARKAAKRENILLHRSHIFLFFCVLCWLPRGLLGRNEKREAWCCGENKTWTFLHQSWGFRGTVDYARNQRVATGILGPSPGMISSVALNWHRQKYPTYAPWKWNWNRWQIKFFLKVALVRSREVLECELTSHCHKVRSVWQSNGWTNTL